MAIGEQYLKKSEFSNFLKHLDKRLSGLGVRLAQGVSAYASEFDDLRVTGDMIINGAVRKDDTNDYLELNGGNQSSGDAYLRIYGSTHGLAPGWVIIDGAYLDVVPDAGFSGQIRLSDGLTYLVNDTGDIDIYTDAQKTIELQTPVYDDLMVSVLSAKAGLSNAPGFAQFMDDAESSPSTGVFLYWFDATAVEELFFAVQLPHTWIEGSDIYPHIHWTPSTTSDGNPASQKVVWGLEYTWADIGEDFLATEIITGSAHSPADADVVAGRHYVTPLGTISPDSTQGHISSMLVCRVFRMANSIDDNYEHDAGLLQIDFHYQVDTMGSRQETTK